MDLSALLADESARQREFPVCAQKIFLAHAAVCAVPRVCADAQIAFARHSTVSGPDEYVQALRQIKAAARRVRVCCPAPRPTKSRFSVRPRLG